jgi:hypothetical protein
VNIWKDKGAELHVTLAVSNLDTTKIKYRLMEDKLIEKYKKAFSRIRDSFVMTSQLWYERRCLLVGFNSRSMIFGLTTRAFLSRINISL